LLECEAIVDHVHLLLDVADQRRLPRVMNDLKGISARRVFAEFPELKMDAETEHFWQQGYERRLCRRDEALHSHALGAARRVRTIGEAVPFRAGC
jgi:REP element-mobilizing transposase RayT